MCGARPSAAVEGEAAVDGWVMGRAEAHHLYVGGECGSGGWVEDGACGGGGMCGARPSAAVEGEAAVDGCVSDGACRSTPSHRNPTRRSLRRRVGSSTTTPP